MSNNGNNDKSLESWIWDAACSIRDAKDAPKYKEYILPLIFANLNFNAEFLTLDRAVGDYVIVHELLHFSVPHHGKLWKSLMRAHLGDYEKLDRKLKRFADRTGS